MILTKPKSVNAGPSSGTGEGVAHSKRWYVARAYGGPFIFYGQPLYGDAWREHSCRYS